jgi:hypothetical protein
MRAVRLKTLKNRLSGYLITRNVTDFLELIRSLIKQQESHVGIILVPASFPGDEFALLADAIVQPVATFPRVSPIWFYS